MGTDTKKLLTHIEEFYAVNGCNAVSCLDFLVVK